ncbi:MAG: DUF4330 family protein [Clostridia bacterium]|nr:DUF4330 family protein [Clostridia bacterium]
MNRTSRRRGLNLFDAFVLLLVVAVGLVAFWFIRGTGAANSSSGTPVAVTYKVELVGLPADIRDSAKTGVAVRDGVRLQNIGTVTEVSSTNYYLMLGDPVTGEVRRSEVEGLYNVTVTCEAVGELRGSRVMIGEYMIAIGQQVAMQSPGISGVGYCVGLDYTEIAS